MEKLVIMNYSTAEVHFYDVDYEAAINEESLRNLGHNPDECSWMFAEEISIIHHKGILK